MNDFQIEDGVLVKYTGTDADVVIPEGVTSIGDNSFSGCESLVSINIPKGVTSIGDGAFDDCKSLVNINIPEGVTSIGSYAFRDCESLVNINLPEGVTFIDSSVFKRCKSLVNINIPEGVTSIGRDAFEGCESLKKIFISAEKISLIRAGDKTVVRAAFWGCLTAYAKKNANKVEREGFSEFVKMYLKILGNLIIDNVENINSIIHEKLITVETAEELLERCTTAECRAVLLDYINANIGDSRDFDKYKLKI